MAIVESLLSTAYEDTQLLTKLDEGGDKFSIARDVDFVLKTEELSKAQIVTSFVADNRYGVPRIEEVGGCHRVIITIHMPITQHVLCSVSALMMCLAQLFSLDYDGWGCIVQRQIDKHE